MEEYKSSDKRLAGLFKKSRDRWQGRVAEKQKKLRYQAVKIRWIKTALEHCSFAKVEAWFQEVFGQSPLAKRRAVFRAFNVDT